MNSMFLGIFSIVPIILGIYVMYLGIKLAILCIKALEYYIKEKEGR